MRKKEQKPGCPNCSGQSKKYGIRKNKLQNLQQYRCKDCKKKFTLNPIKQKTYPASIILNAISNYNLGYTLEKSANFINQRFKTNITPKNVQLWVKEFQNQLLYNKIRNDCKKLHSPENIIEQHTLMHSNLPYKFQVHKAKLFLLFHSIKYNNQFHNISKFYEPIKNYLGKVPTKKFPHHIFKDHKSSKPEIADLNNINNEKLLEQRASQLKLNALEFTKLAKNNLANKLAKLALSDFKCAWFDENSYFEFYPLHAVYAKEEEALKIADKLEFKDTIYA